jgi:4-hydroxy-3-methylbut-2-en-1-yl diphosphate reductase
MCFGVRDALAAAESVANPNEVTIYGHLVHNEAVEARLRERGFPMLPEAERTTPATPEVLVTAHGISGVERGRLAAAGLRIHDTTCPLVRHAHAVALTLDSEDRLVIVVGKPDHVEVRGLVGDLRRSLVIERREQVTDFGEARIGVLAQTTTTDAELETIVAEIHAKNPSADVKVVSTICRPTRERQQSVARLLDEVDLLVVVGGRASRNSKALVETARRAGIEARLVQDANDLEAAWFEGVDAVGVTAGTSTLEETFDAVVASLRAIASRAPTC